jgi:hypothetical protein
MESSIQSRYLSVLLLCDDSRRIELLRGIRKDHILFCRGLLVGLDLEVLDERHLLYRGFRMFEVILWANFFWRLKWFRL